MLGLKLRDEFAGKRQSGTIIDFKNSRGTGALDRSAEDFLAITYPSIDLLKILESVQPDSTKPVVIIGSRGQGKSHMMAALAHMLKDTQAGERWLEHWSASNQNDAIDSIKLRSGMHVIAESLHLHNYKFLWDLLFDRHPAGDYAKGLWEAEGDSQTSVPGESIILKMLKQRPTVLILDEFQTWFEGLTNTKQFPWKIWAFNFIQILSEIAQSNPELLVLVVSVREGDSDAAQQIYRVDTARIDFKSPQAKIDRRRLLLYRLFENRLQIQRKGIEDFIATHVNEYLRIKVIPTSEHDRHRSDFLDAWPFSPVLLKLLDDQVLIAVDAQETRDLLRILVDVYKQGAGKSRVITAANFSIINEKTGVGALLDSVSSQLHRNLREKARRNLDAVTEALSGSPQAGAVPHLEPVLSALWLRSLSVENLAGAAPDELHCDITQQIPIDDNQFDVELDLIEQNSFNIHRRGNRLVFLNEENPKAKLMANAQNDRLFKDGEDVVRLADEIRYVLAGVADNAAVYRVIVLRREWQIAPWSEVDEKNHPDKWDNRIPVIVVPNPSVGSAELGRWLKTHVTKDRNTLRFLLPVKDTTAIFHDKALLVLARAVHLAQDWMAAQKEYSALHQHYQKELREQIKKRFDRFAVLETWNFVAPEKCAFAIEVHKATGDQILNAIDSRIRTDLFIQEEFEPLVLEAATHSRSVAEILDQLREPMPNGQLSIPWLGEVEVVERIIRLCAAGKIAINLGNDWLQPKPGESDEDAWHRMKGRLPKGKALEQVTLNPPGAAVTSGGHTTTDAGTAGGQGTQVGQTGGVSVGGGTPPDSSGTTSTEGTQGPGGTEDPTSDDGSNTGLIPGLFGSNLVQDKSVVCSAPPTAPINLLGKIKDSWSIQPGTTVRKLQLSIDASAGATLTGAQLEGLIRMLIRDLPEGLTCGIDLEKD